MEITFKAKDFIIDFKRTYVMGILNVTPDSFSDGNKYFCVEDAVKHAIEMVQEGADIIDVGGQSTRPGYDRISAELEWNRIKDVIPLVRKEVSVPISVDTFYSCVAEKAILSGADIVNDVTGFSDKGMYEVVRNSSCGCVVTSNVGLDKTPSLFLNVLKIAEELKVPRENFCFDPGIGFGKTHEQNLKILSGVKKYCPDGHAILIGASRKRVTGIPCGNPDFEKRLPATIAAHTFALMSGANIIRVHDVQEAVQAAKMTDEIIKFVNKDNDVYG